MLVLVLVCVRAFGVQVVVPAGVGAGSVVAVQTPTRGTSLLVAVPEGAAAGDSFIATVNDAADEDDGDSGGGGGGSGGGGGCQDDATIDCTAHRL